MKQTVDGAIPNYGPALEELQELFEREAPGPSTQAIIDAARRRNIPVDRTGPLSLLQLGYGARRRLLWSAMTDRTSAIGVEIAQDKDLTRQLLRGAGVPITSGATATSVEQALDLFEELGAPVVVKPRDGRQGEHVYLDLNDRDAVEAAFTAAGGDVVIERQVDGRDYRVLVVGGRAVAATERLPARVVGDGGTSVAALVDRENADSRRGDGHANVLTRLRFDDEAAAELLARQDLSSGSVPEAGRTVWLRRNANLSTGGTATDVTDRMHPDVADLCVRAAAVVGLDIAGIDLRLPDIAEPPAVDGDPARGGVIEVNAAPGLRMHLAPSAGQPRAVGDAIVDALFEPGDDGRIPTVAVTGTNGKTTVARLIAHLLAGTGLRVGLTTTDGVSIGGRMVQRGDATGPQSARVVLTDPTVEAAVLETARGGMMRRGLGYDWTDVGVITNVTGDHLGQDGLATVEDIADVKALVAERVRDGGTLVLNADDPRVRQMVNRSAVRAGGKRLVWFSLDARSPAVQEHLRGGGTAYLADGGQLVEATGEHHIPVLDAADVPGAWAGGALDPNGTAGYAAANALAAIAAAVCMGVPREAVPRLLKEFGTRDNPGRGMLFRRGDIHIAVDYAHNPAAIAAVTGALHRHWGSEHCVAVVTLPGDRRDDVIIESAHVLADGYGRIVCYEDQDTRGRERGELRGLLVEAVTTHRPDSRCETATTLAEAVDKALAMARPGEVLLLLYEKLEPVLALLDSLDAAATVPASTVASTTSSAGGVA